MSVWSIWEAFAYGYVHDPYVQYAWFTKDPDCAVLNHFIATQWDATNKRYNTASGNAHEARCKTPCAECKRIAIENDYVRGYLPPNYPVPATIGQVDITNDGHMVVWYTSPRTVTLSNGSKIQSCGRDYGND